MGDDWYLESLLEKLVWNFERIRVIFYSLPNLISVESFNLTRNSSSQTVEISFYWWVSGPSVVLCKSVFLSNCVNYMSW